MGIWGLISPLVIGKLMNMASLSTFYRLEPGDVM